jgi:hypothetical protein
MKVYVKLYLFDIQSSRASRPSFLEESRFLHIWQGIEVLRTVSYPRLVVSGGGGGSALNTKPFKRV